MKADYSNDEVTPRRTFFTRLSAAAIGIPLLASIADAQRRGGRKQPTRSASPSSRNAQRPTIKACEPGVPPVTHEPPIGFTDGSLMIDLPRSAEISQVNNVSGDPRPFKHIFRATNFTGIEEVRVLTRPRAGRPFFVRYQLPEDSTFQVRLWLVQLKQQQTTQDEDDYDAPTAEPQLILRPTSPQIEAVVKLRDNGLSHKHSVPRRFDVPPFARHFHIGKWAITDAAGNVVKDAAGIPFSRSGDDSYELFVSFYHP